MRRLAWCIVATTLITASLTGVAALDAAPARAADSYSYTCWTGTPIPQYLTQKSDPRNCKGLYKVSKGGVYVAVIDNRRIKNWSDFKKVVMGAYSSAQKWCSSNSLTCTVLTAVGVAALQGVWSSINA